MDDHVGCCLAPCCKYPTKQEDPHLLQYNPSPHCFCTHDGYVAAYYATSQHVTARADFGMLMHVAVFLYHQQYNGLPPKLEAMTSCKQTLAQATSAYVYNRQTVTCSSFLACWSVPARPPDKRRPQETGLRTTRIVSRVESHTP